MAESSLRLLHPNNPIRLLTAPPFAIALGQLAKDPIRYVVVIGAFFPDMMRETIRDQTAEAGITEEDLRELIQKLGGVPGTKH
jgi:hypothetical protein